MSLRSARLRIEPFATRVSDETLRDLTARIRNTRWPEPAPGRAWDQGTDRDYLRSSSTASETESAYLEQAAHWDETERGYKAIQSTKPQTLGYGLHDSPVGLAAWILEKWRSWSDSGGDLDAHLPRDFLLTIVTLYWVTGTITSSMRDYFDNRRWQGEPRLSQNGGARLAVTGSSLWRAPRG